ncbi:MAG: restriction endonuclease subunit S, partial [Cyanobacteria bacterium P01_H01_bin.15]
PAKELMTSDFPRFGYLSELEKKVVFSEVVLSRQQHDLLFLRPHDVVVSIKGLTGAVAIAPQSTPPAGEGGWLVNQSCLILRANEKIIDPVYLYMYLASEAGQALLAQISNGASTSMISIQSLKSLAVPIPTMKEMREMTEIFYEQVSLQQEIDSRIARQVELSKQYWSL